MRVRQDLHFTIEFAVPGGEPAKTKGDLFEALAKAYLSQQSFYVIQNIRFTGTEIDLLCKHAVSGRRLIAECKSQREAIQSAAIDALFTDVSLHQADEGWIISRAPLGRDAKGKLENIRALFPGRYSHVSGHCLVEQCLSSGYLRDPRGMLRADDRLSSEVTLILAPEGPFWCLEKTSTDGTIVEGHALLRADTLQPVQQSSVLSGISDTVDRFADAKWIDLSSSENIEQGYNQPIVADSGRGLVRLQAITTRGLYRPYVGH